MRFNAELNQMAKVAEKADLRVEVKVFWKHYLHLTPFKVMVFEEKSKNQFEGKNLSFDKWF